MSSVIPMPFTKNCNSNTSLVDVIWSSPPGKGHNNDLV